MAYYPIDENAALRAEVAEPLVGDGFELRENAEKVRIQFVFDGKPDEATRTILKAHGFRWAPSEGAWQRLLNDNGRHAAREVVRLLKEAAHE